MVIYFYAASKATNVLSVYFCRLCVLFRHMSIVIYVVLFAEHYLTNDTDKQNYTNSQNNIMLFAICIYLSFIPLKELINDKTL